MSLTELEQWELKLRNALDTVDRTLEQLYSSQFPRHPNRPAAGTTSSPKADGLFSVTSAFSLGLATGNGPGYIIRLRTATMLPLSQDEQEDILRTAEKLLPEAIAASFPERHLTVTRQGDVFLLSGDLSF